MTSAVANPPQPVAPAAPAAAVRDIKPSDDGLKIVVRLSNPNARALHYIGNPRMILYDAATRTLTVRLSDAGRVLVPGGIGMHPIFRVLDPNGQADVTVDLPPTIVRLAPPGPGGEVRFEEHDLRQAATVAVEVGWSDIPFYDDPREGKADVMPAAAWERGAVAATAPMPKRRAAR